VQDLLFGQEQQSHRDILEHLELALLAETGLVEGSGVVLEVDVAVGEGDDALVAVVLGEVGTNLGLHVGEEAALVPQLLSHPLPIQAGLLDQAAPSSRGWIDRAFLALEVLSFCEFLVDLVVHTEEGDEVVEPVGDVGEAAFGDGQLHGLLDDLDGGEDGIELQLLELL